MVSESTGATPQTPPVSPDDPKPDAPAPGGRGRLREMLAGFTHIRSTRLLLAVMSIDLLAVLFGGAVALLPVYAKDILQVGPAGLGLLSTAPAVGAAVLFSAVACSLSCGSEG